MFATYTLKKDELNLEFIEDLKRLIKTDEFILSIECHDETEYLLRSPLNREILLNRIRDIESGNDLIRLSVEDLEKLG